MTHQPHDRLVKAVFSQERQAAALLRAFLPPTISQRLDFSTLQLVADSFVDEELSEPFTDLLFTVRMEGSAALLYVLCEHQSTEPPLRIVPRIRRPA